MSRSSAVRALLVTLATAILASCASSPPAAVPAATQDAGTFVVTLGTDTVSAETFSRTGNRVEGTIVRRVPRTAVMRYVMTLAPNGLASRLEYNTRLPDGGMIPNGARSVTVTFTADSAVTEVLRDSVVTRRVAARNAFPEMDGGIYFFSLPIAALRQANRDSARFDMYPAGATQPGEAPVARRAASNRWWVYSFGNPFEFVTDDAGRILSGDGSRSTFRFQTRRLPPMDLAPMAMAFLQRERASGPIVALSPRDSAIATIGGARISVSYGRPAARGRRIWGATGVLGDTLWRTGANQSTQFSTSAAVTIGGQLLQAGQYMLMTLAVPGRYQLIFYSRDVEVLRVPLTARPLTPAVERFTILVEPTTDRGGMLRLQWDTQELFVPFSAAP
jgi:hypothetical protein